MKNKKIIIIISIIILAVLGAVIIALSLKNKNQISVSYPKEFTVLDASNAYENQDIVKAIGFSPASFIKYMQNKSIFSVAVNSKNTAQFTVTEITTNLSEEVDNLNICNQAKISAIAENLFNGNTYTVLEYGNYTFLEYVQSVKAEENYRTVQIITIYGGKLYTINYYSLNNTLKADVATAEKVASSLSLPDKNNLKNIFIKGQKGFYSVLITAVIILLTVAIILLVVSIFKDIKKRKTKRTFKKQ